MVDLAAIIAEAKNRNIPLSAKAKYVPALAYACAELLRELLYVGECHMCGGTRNVAAVQCKQCADSDGLDPSVAKVLTRVCGSVEAARKLVENSK